MAWGWGKKDKDKGTESKASSKPAKSGSRSASKSKAAAAKGTSEPKTESNTAAKESTSAPIKRPKLSGFPEALVTQLYQIAKLRPVEGGDKVSIQPGHFCINPDTEILVVMKGKGKRGVAHRVQPGSCVGPVMFNQLSQFNLHAKRAGVLVQFSATDLYKAKPELRNHITDLAREFDQNLVGTLMTRSHDLEQRNYMLSNRIYHQSELSRKRFIDTALVKKVVQRIPRLPVSTLKLLNTLQDPDCTPEQVTELVLQDPSLVSLLLKTINSPQYTLPAPVTDVTRVTVLLGYEGVYQLIMAGGLKKSLPDNKLFRESYERAIELSQLAYAVAKVSGRASPTEMSTIGLLHDVGLLVSQILMRQSPDFKGVVSLVDTGELGGQLLKSWSLPDTIYTTVQQQNHPEFASLERIDQDNLDRVALLFVARQLHRQMMQEQTELEAIFLKDYLGLLGWDGKTLDQLWSNSVIPLLRTRRNALPLSMREL